MKKVEDFISDGNLELLAGEVKEAEKHTSGEIRVCLLVDFEFGIGSIDVQAEAIFLREGLHQTRDRTGVLILVVFNKRQLRIMADSGINAKLTQGYWDDLAAFMVWFFKLQLYYQGIRHAVRTVGNKLAEHFPRAADDFDELPDDIITGKEQGRCDHC